MKKVIVISTFLLLGTLTAASAQCKFKKNFVDERTHLLNRMYSVKDHNFGSGIAIDMHQEGGEFMFAIRVYRLDYTKVTPLYISFVLKNSETIELHADVKPTLGATVVMPTTNPAGALYVPPTYSCTFYCSVSANTMKQFSLSEIADIKIYGDDQKIYYKPKFSDRKIADIKEIAACFLQP